MSVEFNSTISDALENAKQRRLTMVGRSEKLLAQDPNIAKSIAASGLSSTLSVEDIASAMKSNSDENKLENEFLELHRVTNKKHKDDNDVNEIDSMKSIEQQRRTDAIHETQNKVDEIKKHSNMMYGMQNLASNRLTGYRVNPFGK